MRSFYRIRSICIGSFAIIASLLVSLHAPAFAAPIPIDAGYHVTIQSSFDYTAIVCDVMLAPDRSQLDQGDRQSVISVAGFEPLKPEYAESYASAGHNFIDLRRRC